MSSLRRFRIALPMCSLALLLSYACPSAEAGLSKRQLQRIENSVLPAYNRGDTLGTLQSLSQAIGKWSDEQVEELDDLLAEQNLPTSGELLVRSRLALLHQHSAQRLPKPTLREQLVVLAHIKRELESLLDEAANHPILGDDLPNSESLDDFENLLWETHVIEQRLITSATLARYAADSLKTKQRYRVDALNVEHRSLLDTDFAAFEARLAETHRTLREREIEVRIERLKLANAALRDSQDIKNRLIAASVVDIDGDLILKALAKGPYQNETLNLEFLAEEVEHLVRGGRKAAGDLLEKSRLLYTGLHWWYRGRYGMGTDGFGLLKSPAALSSEQAQFALYMPTEPPKPTDPTSSDGYEIPEYNRRHHYIWAWEYRKVTWSRNNSKRVVAEATHGTETKLSRFY